MSETKIRAGLSVTCNLGNFQNIKIEFAIEDFKREGESIEQASERVFNFVESELESRLDETVKNARKRLNG
jgi:hypothetical protein